MGGMNYYIKTGVNDRGPHFSTREGGVELTPHCLVMACCNRNKQKPAFYRLIPLFNKHFLPLWPLTACWASLRGCGLGRGTLSRTWAISCRSVGVRSLCHVGGGVFYTSGWGSRFKSISPFFFLCSTVAKFSLWGTLREHDSISHARLARWHQQVTRLTNNGGRGKSSKVCGVKKGGSNCRYFSLYKRKLQMWNRYKYTILICKKEYPTVATFSNQCYFWAYSGWHDQSHGATFLQTYLFH